MGLGAQESNENNDYNGLEQLQKGVKKATALFSRTQRLLQGDRISEQSLSEGEIFQLVNPDNAGRAFDYPQGYRLATTLTLF